MVGNSLRKVKEGVKKGFPTIRYAFKKRGGIQATVAIRKAG